MSTEKIIDIIAAVIVDQHRDYGASGARPPDWPEEAARAALTALQSSGYMVIEGWKPIDTAPKDGTVIDLHHSKHGRIRSMYWDTDDEFWIAEDEDKFLTHWISLPPPPQAQGESEERSDTDGAEQLGSGLTQKKEAPNG
jgi:hypothetical protein